MADWILVPCLDQLRNELNYIAPSRDKASDGTIGDAAHSGDVSDHNPDETGRVTIRDVDRVNEVHAYDADKDLRTPGLDMEKVVQFLLARCRSGAERRLRYIIYRRRIWEASNGWRQRTYKGANAHDQHAHFSASYDTKHEYSRASWHLEDIPVALTAADKSWMSSEINKAVIAAVAAKNAAHLAQAGAEAAAKAVEGLTEETKLKGPDGKEDGTIRTDIGHYAMSQGVPNPFNENGGRSPVHVIITETARRVKGMTDGPTPV